MKYFLEAQWSSSTRNGYNPFSENGHNRLQVLLISSINTKLISEEEQNLKGFKPPKTHNISNCF